MQTIFIYFVFITTRKENIFCFYWKPWKELQSLEDWRGSEETTLTSVPALILHWCRTFKPMVYLICIQGNTLRGKGYQAPRDECIWAPVHPSSGDAQRWHGETVVVCIFSLFFALFQQGGSFSTLVKQTLQRCPCSPERPWEILLYSEGRFKQFICPSRNLEV